VGERKKNVFNAFVLGPQKRRANVYFIIIIIITVTARLAQRRSTFHGGESVAAKKNSYRRATVAYKYNAVRLSIVARGWGRGGED